MEQTNAEINKNEHAEDDERISEIKEKNAYTDPSDDTDLNTNKQANGRESRVLGTKTSKNSLSAGRCQTPALRLIYDNYLEIERSPGSLIYNTSGCFTNMNLLFELKYIS